MGPFFFLPLTSTCHGFAFPFGFKFFILFGDFNGWQTSQSFRQHCFQWAIICLELAQWLNLQVLPSEHSLRWVKTFLITSQCGMVHFSTCPLLLPVFLIFFSHLAAWSSKINCCWINFFLVFSSGLSIFCPLFEDNRQNKQISFFKLSGFWLDISVFIDRLFKVEGMLGGWLFIPVLLLRLEGGLVLGLLLLAMFWLLSLERIRN